MTKQEQEFHSAMHKIYYEAKKEIGYTGSRFLQMIHQHGGVSAAKILINATGISDGYAELWKEKRLDLTVEALVYENSEWHSLFTSDEIEKCRKRLIDCDYNPKNPKQ